MGKRCFLLFFTVLLTLVIIYDNIMMQTISGGDTDERFADLQTENHITNYLSKT